MSSAAARIAGGVIALLLTAALVSTPLLVRAASQPTMGTTTGFAVLAGSAITNTGPTTVTGDLGLSPGSSVTGFPPGTVNGAVHVADGVAVQAKSDLVAAHTSAAAQPCTSTLTGDLGGRTLVPGVYCFTTSAQLTGTLTLNGNGDPNAVFIIRAGSTLTTASNSRVVVINGGPCGVFWQTGSSATLGTDTAFVGTMLVQASITLDTGANILPGRALAETGAVTLDGNLITTPPATCSVASSSSTTTLTSSPNPASAGTPVVLTATVAPAVAGPTPTGTVAFTEGSTTLGTATLDSGGKATLTTSALAIGTHTIVAVYSGASSSLPSASPPLVQTVTASPTPTATPTGSGATSTPTPAPTPIPPPPSGAGGEAVLSSALFLVVGGLVLLAINALARRRDAEG